MDGSPPIATRIGVESMVSARTTYARRFRAPNRTQSKLALSFPGEAPVKKLKVGQGAVFTALEVQQPGGSSSRLTSAAGDWRYSSGHLVPGAGGFFCPAARE
jgi:hypothetical protein